MALQPPSLDDNKGYVALQPPSLDDNKENINIFSIKTCNGLSVYDLRRKTLTEYVKKMSLCFRSRIENIVIEVDVYISIEI